MKLYIKQKVFSWADKFNIKDASGRDCYYVEGKVFSFGKKLHIYDSSHREVAYIHEKLFTFMPRYYIELNGQTIEIVKEFTLFKPSFRFEGLPLRLSGDFWEHNYTLSNNGQNIMRLTKQCLTWGDTYELDIAEHADELLCLCVALVVDCVLDAQNSSSVSSNQ